MKTTFKWACPLCPHEGEIARASQSSLDIATASHILGHEDRASVAAVDRARLGCGNTACELGKNMHWNVATGKTEPKISEYDIKLLQTMKVRIE